jgi:Flp pilus assembly protein TadG
LRFHRRESSAQRGVALLEFALCLPLILSVIYGTWTLISISRAKLRLAGVAHAVMREAAAGTVDAQILTRLAKGYAKASGVPASWMIEATVDQGTDLPFNLMWIPNMALRYLAAEFTGGIRVGVRARVPVSGALRLIWPGGIPMECSSVCLYDTWHSPITRVIMAVIPSRPAS